MELAACWGYLVPYGAAYPPIELRGSEIKAGRDPTCTVHIQGVQLGIKQELISKHHFRLVHGPQGALLKDESKAGTYVNGQLVGRGKQALLPHAARIDIVRFGVKAFVFLDKAASEATNYPKIIKDKYLPGNQLGEGGFGQVFLVLNRAEVKRYAMKIVKNTSVAKREAQILREIKHPCMVRAYEILVHSDHLYLVLEYVAGGDLSRWVNDRRLLSEKQIKLLFYQLALAVQYMHQQSITHRDLKPANILMADNKPHSLIKVTDFGLAKDLELHSNMTTCAGTEVYLAPDVIISKPYTNKVDIWSMGVILYYSLSGVLPFYSLKEALRAQHNVMFSTARWKTVSLAALELVRRMLVSSPERRASINEVLTMPWLQDEAMKADAHTLMGINARPAVTVVTQTPVKHAVRMSPSPIKPTPVIPMVLPGKPTNLTPSPNNQRQPVSPRGVLQYLGTASPGGTNQEPTRVRSPNAPLQRDTPLPRFGTKLPPVHKAQKTFLMEARKNLKPAWKP